MQKIIILFILIMTLSCSLDPVIIDPESLGDYFVFCTLCPGFNHQSLLLVKTKPEKLPTEITDAVVTINSDIQSVQFTHIKKGVYQDVVQKLIVKSGMKYNLNIELTDGRIITGQTILPGHYKITSPSAGDTIQHFLSQKLDTLLLPHVKWTKSVGAKYYTVLLDLNDSLMTNKAVSTFRNDIIFPELIPKFSWGDTIECEKLVKTNLYVFARDSSARFIPMTRAFLDSFTDYTSMEEDDWFNGFQDKIQGYDSTKIKLYGAIGVFNGISMEKEEIYMKVNIDWLGIKNE